MRTTSNLAVAALALVLAAGCGGSDDDPDVEAVTRTYETYIAAVKRGDGAAACKLLTKSFQRRITNFVPPPKQKQLRGASCALTIARGTLPQIQQVEPDLERVEVTGDRARGVDPGEGLIGAQELVFQRVGGKWKIDNAIYFR